MRGHKSVLFSVTRLQEIKNPIIYKPGPRSQPCLCPNGHHFFQQSCYVGNPLSYKYALQYIYSQYHIMREKCYIFLGHSHPLRGGTCPPRPPLKSGTANTAAWSDMGPGLENSTRPLVFTSASGCRASEYFDISSKNQIFPMYANKFCDARQVPIFRYFEACGSTQFFTNQ